MRNSKLQTELARMRIAAKIPQKELARRLGIGRDHLAKIEAGIRKSNRVEKDAFQILCAGAH